MNEITFFGILFVILPSLTYLAIRLGLDTPENRLPKSLFSDEQREKVRQHEARIREGMEKGGINYDVFRNVLLGFFVFIGVVMVLIGLILNPQPIHATKPPASEATEL